MKNRITKALSVILAVLILASLALLAGCGDDKAKTEATSATKAVSPTTATAAPTQAPTAALNTSPDEEDVQSTDSDDDDEDDGYIDEETAIANVKQLAGTGAQIISTEKGYSPDGIKAWIIVVAPVTTGDGPETVTYYSGNQFCYPENTSDSTQSDDSDDGYIDEATAIANVRQLAGSGAQIISSEKGYSPDGIKAWVVVVAPVTTEDGPDTVTYYSGEQFCYPAGN